MRIAYKLFWGVGLLLLALSWSTTHAAVVPAREDFFTGLIITWEEEDANAGSLWVRTREIKTGEWTEWYEVERDEDTDEKDSSAAVTSAFAMTHETLFSTNLSSSFEYQVRGDYPHRIKNISIEKILSNARGEPRLVAGLSIPSKYPVISRAEWGANEELTFENQHDVEQAANGTNGGETGDERTTLRDDDPEIKRVITDNENGRHYLWPLEYRNDTKFIVIHHTASVKNLYEPKTAIQNIYYYHAVKRGWGDIGYHYIIAPNGQIFEGRKGGDDVVGGHARPVNKVSIGISVLGNYDIDDTPEPVLKSLMTLIESKAKKYDLAINGETRYKDVVYTTIHGHYKNTPTACPGIFLKEKMDAMRALITYDMQKKGSVVSSPYQFSDIDKRSILNVSPQTKKKFTIRLKNTGTKKWNADTFIENIDPATTPFPQKILAQLSSNKNVDPGEIGVFKGTLPVVVVGGLFVPQARLVVNASVRPEGTFPIPVLVHTPKMTYEIVNFQAPPEIMKPGEKATVRIVLKNTGELKWKRGGKTPIQIGTINPKDRKSVLFGKKNRVGRLVQREVKPGETGTFLLTFTAPRIGGVFKEHLAPIMENVGWLADQGMYFKVKVDRLTKPVRIALSTKKKNPRIRSESGMSLYEGEKKVGQFDEGVIVKVSYSGGKYLVKAGEVVQTLSSPPRFEGKKKGILEITNYENRPAWNRSLNDNLFRGVLEVNYIDGKLKVINELQLEDYLKGIAEVSNGDPPEKIKTIIILARSYAQYYRDQARKFPGKPYDLDDDPDHTQKYIGYSLELRAPNLVTAVEDTYGLIVTYNGAPVITPYFNQSDGRTRSAQEVWGWTHTPYLKSVSDEVCGKTELRGHGVGLSGCGATELAKQGKTAEEIINYYYTGVKVEIK